MRNRKGAESGLANTAFYAFMFDAQFFTFGIRFGKLIDVVHNFVGQWQFLTEGVGSETIESDGLRILDGVEDKTASGNVNVSLYHGKCNSV